MSLVFNQKITLDLTISRVQNVHCSQDDDKSRSILITLSDNGKPYFLEDVIKIYLKINKPDNTFIYIDEDDSEHLHRNDDGTISIILSDQATAVPGICEAELQLLSLDEELTTRKFNIIVKKSVVSDSAVESLIETNVVKKFLQHLLNHDNPHQVTKEQVGLGNIENLSINDQMPTYEEAEELENISSGEKMSTILGKIKRAITSLIAHINNFDNPHKITKSQIKLENVDNTSDVNKPVSTAQQKAIDDAYANSNKYTDKKVADLINGAPETLDTLKEVADAIEASKTVEEALNNAIGKKANQSELDTHTSNDNIHIIPDERTKWNDANDKKHSHDNKSVLDTITSELVEKWSNGSSLTGIKGDAETDYRTGNVNLTAENIGAVASDGEVTENTVDYDSADVEDGNASLSWLSIPAFTKANVNKVGAMFTNVARLFRNVRYLYKMLGTTDISKIGNGTCTGAISSLNSSLAKCLSVDGQHATYNPISDLNIFYNGIGLFTNPTLNMPGDGWFLVISGGVGGTTCQRAVSLFGGSTFHRYCASSNWSSWAVDNYLPLSGGTITGNVSTNGGATFATDGNVYLNSNGYKDWLTNILNGKINTSASCNKNWNWSGQAGQPSWLWGGNDGTNMYVYNPSNFTVYRCTGGINKGGNGVGISGEATYFRTYNNSGSPVNNVMGLGSSNARWKQLYAATTTISTSDRNMKDNIRELTEIHKNFFMKLVPVSFTFKDGESGRTHVGFIAQDVEQAMTECGLTALDFAGFCKDVKVEAYLDEKSGEYEERPLLDEEGNEQYVYSLRYEEFIGIITYVLQDNVNEVNRLKKDMDELKNEISDIKSIIGK